MNSNNIDPNKQLRSDDLGKDRAFNKANWDKELDRTNLNNDIGKVDRSNNYTNMYVPHYDTSYPDYSDAKSIDRSRMGSNDAHLDLGHLAQNAPNFGGDIAWRDSSSKK